MNVVIVDDMLPNGLMASALLEQLDGVRQTFVFESAEEALAWCRDHEPDLVVTDYLMPGMDGIDFIHRFRDLYPQTFIPVIMVTADSEKSVLVKALEAGATDFLRKPFDAAELRARAGNMLLLRTNHLALMATNRELERLATTDPLTGALNRRAFLQAAEREVERARRYGHGLSVIMIDLDHFKRINDTFGHASGDAALRHFTTEAQALCRITDILGRLGGEEFAVLLPETDADAAVGLAERLRTGSWTLSLPDGTQTITFSISLGIASLTSLATGAGIEEMLRQADRALYQAKAGGRNRVVCLMPST